MFGYHFLLRSHHEVRRKDSCNVLWSFRALWRPNPGHKAKAFGCVLAMSLNVPNVDNKVVASVLLTDLTVVKALINCTTQMI